MSEKKSIYKPKVISGFPEWLPEERIVEQRWFDHIRKVFEAYGYGSIETPSVEELEVITAKGEVDKEIYVLDRLHQDDNDKSEARLALHFDQTVPLARYVAQHFNDLTFPFKRYQMQRVWRGERPQMGRMREFYQCDIDVINVDHLPIHFDAEVAAIMYEVIEGLNIGRVQMRISNRKILMGFLESQQITDPVIITEIMRSVDKLEKIGLDKFRDAFTAANPNLATEVNVTAQTLRDKGIEIKLNVLSVILNFLALCTKKFSSSNELKKAIKATMLDTEYPTIKEGITELCFVLDQLKHLPAHAVVADLSIVRGLDYYTGTVYETKLLDVPEFTGSVCSGGRYDDLAGSYINKHLPGVGISLGFTRLFDVMRQTRPDMLGIGPKSPANILMVLPSEDRRSVADQTARILRTRGYKVELYHAAQKVKKQLAHAQKKGIPFVWFPPFDDGQDHEIKNMQTGEQSVADPDQWAMPE